MNKLIKFIENPYLQLFCNFAIIFFAAFEIKDETSDALLMLILIFYCGHEVVYYIGELITKEENEDE